MNKGEAGFVEHTYRNLWQSTFWYLLSEIYQIAFLSALYESPCMSHNHIYLGITNVLITDILEYECAILWFL